MLYLVLLPGPNTAQVQMTSWSSVAPLCACTRSLKTADLRIHSFHYPCRSLECSSIPTEGVERYVLQGPLPDHVNFSSHLPSPR